MGLSYKGKLVALVTRWHLLRSLTISLLYIEVFLLNALKEEVSYGEKAARELAAATDIDKSVAAAFYSGSLFVVIASLELTTLTHTGIKETLSQMYFHDDSRGSRHLYWPVVVINLAKLGLTLFALTLCVWTFDSDVLTICGFAVVLSLTVTRVLHYFFVYQQALIDEAAAKVTERFRASSPEVAGPATSPAQHRPSIDSLTGGANSTFDGIIVADLNGVITTVNETALSLFGYESKDEIIGKNLSVLCGGSDGKRHDGYVKAFKKKLLDDPSSISQNKVLGRQRMLHACRADGTEFPCVIGIKLVNQNKMIA